MTLLLIGDLLTFGWIAQPSALDGRDMDDNIATVTVPLNEPMPFGAVEPCDGPDRMLMLLRAAPPHWRRR